MCASANLAGEITARCTSGAAEVEFTVEFTCAGSHEAEFTPVTGADMVPLQGGGDFCGAVLCRTEGESLWEICRRYRADPDLTAELNSLQDGRPAADTFLLIPIEG